MTSIKEFEFKSITKFDDDISEIQFHAKGYIKDDCLIYFKNDEYSYKFIINDALKVFVNDSVYEFDTNKKTLAFIKTDEVEFQTSVITDKLIIEQNKIIINYTMDFESFKGNYFITLEWK